MASYIPVPSGYERLFQGPLDPTDTVADLTVLDEYLTSNGTAYKGQIIWVESENTPYVVTSLETGGYVQITFTDHTHELGDITDAGSAAGLDAGTAEGNVPALQAGGKLPSSVLPSLSVGKVHPFADDTLNGIISNQDLADVTGGDIVIADKDGNAGGPTQYIFTGGSKTTAANYVEVSGGSADFSNAPAASETQSGTVEIADQAETNDGTDDSRAVTPLKLKTWLLSHIFKGGKTTRNTDPDGGKTVLLGDASSGLSEHAHLADIDGRIHMPDSDNDGTPDEFVVKGVNVGNLSDGDAFQSGTRVEEIIKQMLQKRIPPNYNGPNVLLSGNGNKLVEVGSNISPTLQATFQQRDAGPESELRFLKNGAQADAQTATPYEFNDSFQIAEEVVEYRAEADHAEGPVKNDNFGDPYPAGHIQAGTVQSGRVRYEGARSLFVGTSPDPISIASSGDVRGLAAEVYREDTIQNYNMLKPSSGDTFDIQVPAGTQSIAICYPYDLGVIGEVIYVENSMQNVTNTFVESQQMVDGANSYTAENYRIYIWTGAAEYPSQVTYRVTI
jgi:hypothetical protein